MVPIKGGLKMLELIFALFFLFIVLKVTLALGFGIIRIAIGLVAAVLVMTLVPLTFALLLPMTFVFLIFAGIVAVLKGILH